MAREIIVLGAIENAKLYLSAPNGKVEFREQVASGSTVIVKAENGTVVFHGKTDGKSRLIITAPNGKVSFPEPTTRRHAGSKIEGMSKVYITAKDVELNGTVSDTLTRVDMALTKEGSLKFNQPRRRRPARLPHGRSQGPEPKVEAGGIVLKNQLRRE